ncbi:MAG: hypothetical protein H0U55_02850 [Rubrobacteraceae bacterium]|nr:hypothetical protein [Rubrobacteraceae bacterium]
MEPELSNTQTYYVPLITDAGGRTLAVHLYNRTDSGPELWLFTSLDRGSAYLSEFMSQPGERDKAVGELLPQAGDQAGSGDLHFGEHFSAKTVPEMTEDLQRWGIRRLVVDPGLPGEQQRIYGPPFS